MSKSPDAFRTIREVADWLGVAAHVLRFWESKFNQIRPVKRAGGRRYYRPADMELVGGIKVLLHDRGMTVRGVQRMLREQGVSAVAELSPPLDAMEVPPELVEGIADEAAWHDDARAEEATIAAEVTPPVETEQRAPEPPVPVEDAAPERETEPEPAPEPEPEPAPAPAPEPELEMAEAAAPPAPPKPAPETAGQGLDRLAAFVASAKDIPDDNRPRLRPAINALKRLKDRMETPVDGTDG
jgi:DNA-binding transcriptional MerR regulator